METLAGWIDARHSPKLDKLKRRLEATRAALSQILCNLDRHGNEDLDKAWDKEAKAADEYFAEHSRIAAQAGHRWVARREPLHNESTTEANL